MIDTTIVTSPRTRNPYLFPVALLTRARCSQSEPSAQHDERLVRGQMENRALGRHDDADTALWWLVHTKPRQEKKLADQLRARNIAHYLPITCCRTFSRGRARTADIPLFAGYLFLWANKTQRRVALETNRIVTVHDVPDGRALSEQLHSLADLIEKGIPLRVEERLVAGQYVRVKSGLLKDMRGTIIKRQGKTRLLVVVNQMLGGVSLEIDQELLEPYEGS